MIRRAVILLALLAPAVASAAAPQPVFGLRAVGNPKLRYFVYPLAAGAAKSGEIWIGNTGTAKGTANLYVADATTGQTSGTVYLTDKAPTSSGTWISIQPRTVTLAPHQRTKITFTHQVQGTNTTKKTSLNIRIRDLVIIAVQVNVPGPPVSKFAIGAITPGGQPEQAPVAPRPRHERGEHPRAPDRRAQRLLEEDRQAPAQPCVPDGHVPTAHDDRLSGAADECAAGGRLHGLGDAELRRNRGRRHEVGHEQAELQRQPGEHPAGVHVGCADEASAEWRERHPELLRLEQDDHLRRRRRGRGGAPARPRIPAPAPTRRLSRRAPDAGRPASASFPSPSRRRPAGPPVAPPPVAPTPAAAPPVVLPPVTSAPPPVAAPPVAPPPPTPTVTPSATTGQPCDPHYWDVAYHAGVLGDDGTWRFAHRCRECGLEVLARDVGDATSQAASLRAHS